MLRVRTAASDEAKVFHTHQLLLGLQSEVFEGLLRNQSVITLHEPPETAALFEKFIRCAETPRDGDAQGDAKEGDVPLGTAGTLWDGDAQGDDLRREMFLWGHRGLCGTGMPRGMS